ncbi:unnamed protein product [Hermetia illucens]|uniref:Bis(5'-nucleosyl)-tetraphosphatase [asymmetrical] n=1 Tax=Hermetia illucens TaxID=343691 RepID=A0A7R8YQY8_HERIL|nr:bis(5'-nucleosyl)-tetraphosphatase [asymmetrical] [Hermetia illucens]CAD7078914.1 unnamed protein product [Hermetia illucens]
MEGRLYRAAGIVIFRRLAGQIQYLLLQASYGDHHWTPPKGFLDPGEDDFSAAVRETTEEAGYLEHDLRIFKDVNKTLEYEVRGKLKTVIYWLAELIDPQKPPTLSDEHQDYKWLPKDEAKVLAKYKLMADLIDCFEEKIQDQQK